MLLLLEQRHRLLEEKAGLEALSTTAPWLVSYMWTLTPSPSYDVCVDAELDIHGTVRRVRLVYPQLFPEVPAYIRPLDASERWSEHQYGDAGALCLEYGADNWHPSITGAQVLQSCADLLFAEGNKNGHKPVSSRHTLTMGQELRTAHTRFVVTPDFRAFLDGIAEGQMSKFSASTTVLDAVHVSVATAGGLGSTEFFEGVPTGMATSSIHNWIRSGIFIHDSELSIPKTTTYSSLKALLTEKNVWPFREPISPATFLAIQGKASRLRVFVVVTFDDKEHSIIEYEVIESEAHASRLPTEFLSLAEKTVAIIGLGSVGSKIAVSLARSGVGNFILVDDDIFLPENLVRHQLTWPAVGFAKVKAVADTIQRVAPRARVITRQQRLAGQENSEVVAATFDKIRAADLVIDATANPQVWVVAAAVSHRAKKPLLWGELFAGGIGAHMARSVPGQDAPPHSIRAGVYQYLEELPAAPYMRAGGYDAVEDETPLIATDADVGMLAASMTQYALDVLTQGIDPAYPYPAYLIGYKKSWIFEAPFDTRPISVPYADWTEHSVPELAADEKQEHADFFKEVLRNAHIIDSSSDNENS
jgi:hypothetical protein